MLIDTLKALDRIHYLFMIKKETLGKIGIKELSLLIKSTYKKDLRLTSGLIVKD